MGEDRRHPGALQPSSLRRLTWASVLMIAAGCGKEFPRAPTLVDDHPAFARPVKVEPPGLADDPPVPYVLLPGDVVHLRTSSVDPMDVAGIIIDNTGNVHVPLAGDVAVGGLGLNEAEK